MHEEEQGYDWEMVPVIQNGQWVCPCCLGRFDNRDAWEKCLAKCREKEKND